MPKLPKLPKLTKFPKVHTPKFPHPWLFLVAAVMAEVIGVICMKVTSTAGSIIALLFMYTMVGLSFYFLALAVERIPIALAYAAWEASGLTIITIVGFFYLGEQLNAVKLLGMGMLIIGVVLINFDAPGPLEADA